MIEPTRQIHLDFHTSEHLPDIGSCFDKSQFQDALKAGHINLVNVFAKCHHSWSYYPTKVGRPHPNLSRPDLLGEQIEACHEIGVAAPIYFTVGWSSNDAEGHPEWCMRTKEGKEKEKEGGIVTSNPTNIGTKANQGCGEAKQRESLPTDPKPTFEWKGLCINTNGDYHDLVMAQTEEICRAYPVDGFWFDIYRSEDICYCDQCRNDMLAKGLDVEQLEQVEEFRAQVLRRHTKALRQLIHDIHPNASVFYNGVTALHRPMNSRYRLFADNTKHDLEDLPTTWGGYDKFPSRAKFFHKEGKPIVAMSGKFHTAWGEFGGFKDPEAIRFEAASMIAYGARCNFGDQLHPLGLMDMTTYENIGHAYRYVEQIEGYGIGGLPKSTLGLWLANDPPADEGLCRMLMEEQMDFDVVRPGDDLESFESVVIPSMAGILYGYENVVKSYLESGGTVLVLGEGLLDAGGSQTSIACGAQYVGTGEFDMDYTKAGDAIRKGSRSETILRAPGRETRVPKSPFLNYNAALRFNLGEESEKLASLHEPYFSRTYGKYCGHQNTPNRPEEAPHPAAWQHGNLIVFAHNLDRLYYQHGAKVHRDYFISALRLIHASPMLEVALPSAGRVSLLHQKDKNRYVAHLLYGVPITRGNCSVIEDLPELRDVGVILRLPVKVDAMRLIPGDVSLDFEKLPGTTKGLLAYRTTVPSFAGHCCIVANH